MSKRTHLGWIVSHQHDMLEAEMQAENRIVAMHLLAVAESLSVLET